MDGAVQIAERFRGNTKWMIPIESIQPSLAIEIQGDEQEIV